MTPEALIPLLSGHFHENFADTVAARILAEDAVETLYAAATSKHTELPAAVRHKVLFRSAYVLERIFLRHPNVSGFSKRVSSSTISALATTPAPVVISPRSWRICCRGCSQHRRTVSIPALHTSTISPKRLRNGLQPRGLRSACRFGRSRFCAAAVRTWAGSRRCGTTCWKCSPQKRRPASPRACDEIGGGNKSTGVRLKHSAKYGTSSRSDFPTKSRKAQASPSSAPG